MRVWRIATYHVQALPAHHDLSMVVDCNYKRLDGLGHGNSKEAQEFEGFSLGAGFDCITLAKGDARKDFTDGDYDDEFMEVLERRPEGDCQRHVARLEGTLLRKEMFQADGLADCVPHFSRHELVSAFMLSGGHDRKMTDAAMSQAAAHKEGGGRLMVILAMSRQAFSLAACQGRNVEHQQKSLGHDEMLIGRNVLSDPLTDEQIWNPEALAGGQVQGLDLGRRQGQERVRPERAS